MSFGQLEFLCLSARTIISFFFFFFVCCAFVFIAGDYVSVCVEGRSSFGEKIFNKILFVLAPDEIETHFGWAPSLLDNLSKY